MKNTVILYSEFLQKVSLKIVLATEANETIDGSNFSQVIPKNAEWK